MKHTLYALRMLLWRRLTGRWKGTRTALPDAARCKDGTQVVVVEPAHYGAQRVTLYELLVQPTDGGDLRTWCPIDSTIARA